MLIEENIEDNRYSPYRLLYLTALFKMTYGLSKPPQNGSYRTDLICYIRFKSEIHYNTTRTQTVRAKQMQKNVHC